MNVSTIKDRPVSERINGYHWRGGFRVCACGSQFGPAVHSSERKRQFPTPFICPVCEPQNNHGEVP